MSNIAIFASGGGSNALEIIRRFKESRSGDKVALLVANKPGIGAIAHAKAHGIPTEVVPGSVLKSTPEQLLKMLHHHRIDFIALAGFLAMVPAEVTREFSGRMVNIHPALLPDYGGKGMYGDHVHRAVLSDGRTETGITIHYVNEVYDDGEIIFQTKTPIDPGETLESLKAKIQKLEHANYPKVIESCLKKLKS
ncbi:MAG: phosphoribosylglycinamide formyltransferase [Cryomorphaceae bacterium]